MANMFSGNIEKKIPKDLKACYKTDKVTQNLWLWCERLEKWGGRICILLGIIGVIQIISAGIEMAEILDTLGIDADNIQKAAEYNIEIRSVSDVVIEGIFQWSLYCFIEYCSYHILALLVGSLANIVQNIKITANIALYNISKAEGISDEVDSQDNEEKSTSQKGYYYTQSNFNHEEDEENDSRNRSSCKKKIHQAYISEMQNIHKDSANAHWEKGTINGFQELICNHCGKVLTTIELENKDVEHWKCLGCGKILPNKTKKCSCGFKKEYL